jgi:hypothetical protein
LCDRADIVRDVRDVPFFIVMIRKILKYSVLVAGNILIEPGFRVLGALRL